jgi:hypothetical protein
MRAAAGSTFKGAQYAGSTGGGIAATAEALRLTGLHSGAAAASTATFAAHTTFACGCCPSRKPTGASCAACSVQSRARIAAVVPHDAAAAATFRACSIAAATGGRRLAGHRGAATAVRHVAPRCSGGKPTVRVARMGPPPSPAVGPPHAQAVQVGACHPVLVLELRGCGGGVDEMGREGKGGGGGAYQGRHGRGEPMQGRARRRRARAEENKAAAGRVPQSQAAVAGAAAGKRYGTARCASPRAQPEGRGQRGSAGQADGQRGLTRREAGAHTRAEGAAAGGGQRQLTPGGRSGGRTSARHRRASAAVGARAPSADTHAAAPGRLHGMDAAAQRAARPIGGAGVGGAAHRPPRPGVGQHARRAGQQLTLPDAPRVAAQARRHGWARRRGGRWIHEGTYLDRRCATARPAQA